MGGEEKGPDEFEIRTESPDKVLLAAQYERVRVESEMSRTISRSEVFIKGEGWKPFDLKHNHFLTFF